MAESKIKMKSNVFVGQYFTVDVDASSTGTKRVQIVSPTVPEGMSRVGFITRSDTFRVIPLGIGGSTLQCEVVSTSTSPITVYIYPVYVF